MSYRDLQQECKSRGLGARGKAGELRARLLESTAGRSPEVPTTAGYEGQGESGAGAKADTPHHDAAPPPSVDEPETGVAGIDLAAYGVSVEGSPSTAAAAQESAGAFDDLEAALEADDADTDGVATAEGSGTFTNSDDSLFDELLRELDEPSDTFYGEAQSERTPTGARGPSSESTGGLSDALDALDALDDLDGTLGGVDLTGSPTDAANADQEGFDGAWLDQLFGPIDAAPAGAPGPRGTPPDAGAAPSWADTSSSSDPNAGLRRQILAESQRGYHRKVLTLMQQWRRADAPVEAMVHKAALFACEKSGAWKEAAALLNEMEDYGLPLQADYFDYALRACDRDIRWVEVQPSHRPPTPCPGARGAPLSSLRIAARSLRRPLGLCRAWPLPDGPTSLHSRTAP